MNSNMNLTPSQRIAVESDASKILVSAGPGSGKSRVLVERIRRLVALGTDPRRIVSLSYTQAAANVLQERLEGIRLGYCGTLHGFALRMLREHGESFGYGPQMTVISPESATTLLESIAKRMNCKASMKELLELKRELSDDDKSVPALAIRTFYRELKSQRIVDFDLLLTEFDRWLDFNYWGNNEVPFDFIFWDEVQDSAAIDWAIFNALPIANKFAVGDSDQSIYGFRGASLQGMLDFAKTAEVITLEENFRSLPEICQAADYLIAHNKERLPKTNKPIRTGTADIALAGAETEGEEIGLVAKRVKSQIEAGQDPKEIAILARSNAIAGAFAKTLEACGVPVAKPEKLDLPRDFAKLRALVELLGDVDNDTLAYFYLVEKFSIEMPAIARARADEVRAMAAKFEISINDKFLLLPAITKANQVVTVAAGYAKFSREALAFLAEKLRTLPDDATVQDLALTLYTDPARNSAPLEGVAVLSLHGSKGKEFDTVFIVGAEEQVTPGTRKNANVEEERRLFYVGMTRAKNQLYITHSASRVTPWGAINAHTPSRFIKEAGL